MPQPKQPSVSEAMNDASGARGGRRGGSAASCTRLAGEVARCSSGRHLARLPAEHNDRHAKVAERAQEGAQPRRRAVLVRTTKAVPAGGQCAATGGRGGSVRPRSEGAACRRSRRARRNRTSATPRAATAPTSRQSRCCAPAAQSALQRRTDGARSDAYVPRERTGRAAGARAARRLPSSRLAAASRAATRVDGRDRAHARSASQAPAHGIDEAGRPPRRRPRGRSRPWRRRWYGDRRTGIAARAATAASSVCRDLALSAPLRHARIAPDHGRRLRCLEHLEARVAGDAARRRVARAARGRRSASRRCSARCSSGASRSPPSSPRRVAARGSTPSCATASCSRRGALRPLPLTVP